MLFVKYRVKNEMEKIDIPPNSELKLCEDENCSAIKQKVEELPNNEVKLCENENCSAMKQKVEEPLNSQERFYEDKTSADKKQKTEILIDSEPISCVNETSADKKQKTEILPDSEPISRDNETSTKEKEKTIHFHFYTKITEGIYQGRKFTFTITITNKYPFNPPKVKCHEKIFHPNIDTEGHVCLNILREEWSCAMGIQCVILGIYSLFFDFCGEDALNTEAGDLLISDRKEFIRRAKMYNS